jgi:hypothetical protein
MYKFLNEESGHIKSEYGDHTWEIGKKYSVKGKIICCENGFHASEKPLDALGYVKGNVLAIVEGFGDCDIEEDKSAHRSMKIVSAYKWGKVDSVELAIFCADLVLKIYEEKYPNDKRPREAIEAAKNWIKNPIAASAASAASAARAASAASAASWATWAAWAAESAARAARAARAASAASAESATWAAWAAAWAASAAITEKINQWMIDRIETLERID